MQETAERPAEATAGVAQQQRARFGGGTVDVLPDLACLPESIVNLFFFGAPGSPDRRWALVDAGLGFSVGRILRAAAARYGEDSRPAAIVLTHGHFDHVGDVRALADRWQAPVFAHPLEMPYLTGRSSYPPPDPAVGGGAMSFFSRIYPRGPIDLGSRVHPLPADGVVPGMPGWRWVHTPGHTPGHVSLFRDADRALIAGDAFVTTRQESAVAVLTQRPEVRPSPAYFTPDWESERRSVELLAGLRPEVAATGHGAPMYGEQLRRGLAELLRDWYATGVPKHGRYVGRPAVCDERGVVSLPPPVWDPQLLAVAGVGLAAAVGAIVLRSAMKDRNA